MQENCQVSRPGLEQVEALEGAALAVHPLQGDAPEARGLKTGRGCPGPRPPAGAAHLLLLRVEVVVLGSDDLRVGRVGSPGGLNAGPLSEKPAA